MKRRYDQPETLSVVTNSIRDDKCVKFYKKYCKATVYNKNVEVFL